MQMVLAVSMETFPVRRRCNHSPIVGYHTVVMLTRLFLHANILFCLNKKIKNAIHERADALLISMDL